MQASSPTSSSISTTYSPYDEEKSSRGDFSCNEGQSTPPNRSSFHSDNSVAHGQNVAGSINELAQAVHILNVSWMKILGDKLLRWEIDAYFATPSPFTTGIEALKQHFCDTVPKTLGEIFSILRIAFAAACLLHHGNKSFPWDCFFQDVLQWNAIIQDPEEKWLFLGQLVLCGPSMMGVRKIIHK